MKKLQGIGVSSKLVIGPVYVFTPGRCKVSEAKITDTETELARFENARVRAQEELKVLYQKALQQTNEESAAIFDIHGMMLDDADYIDSVRGLIQNGRDNAARAVQKTGARFAHMFAEMDDEYMQARASDVQDISQQVIDILCGASGEAAGLQEPSIIVADDLTPSQSMLFEKDKVIGFVTAKGSVTSHMAILARTQGIAAIVGAGEELLTTDFYKKTVILDGTEGTLTVDPTAAVLKKAQIKLQQQQQQTAALEQLKGTADQTKDGRTIKLYANVGNGAELEQAVAADARGIGLFRTEFLYLHANTYPTEEELFAVYKQALQTMNGKPIIFRTLDIGADKTAPYFQLPAEENPALGVRGIRLCLQRPDLFQTQLRALLRASAFGKAALMYPMIASVKELQQANALLAQVKQSLLTAQVPFDEKLPVGIMIETPAAALLSEQFAPLVDFFSIGTNDLTQYTYAADRQNEHVASCIEQPPQAVLQLIKQVVQAAHAYGKWVGICGELAADQSLTKSLLQLGIDELSVAAPHVLPIRRMIQQIDLRK